MNPKIALRCVTPHAISIQKKYGSGLWTDPGHSITLLDARKPLAAISASGDSMAATGQQHYFRLAPEASQTPAQHYYLPLGIDVEPDCSPPAQ